MKILIIQTAFLGDVILATPIIEAVHASYPDAEIHFLLRRGNEGLLVGHPYITKLWIFDKKDGKYRNLMKLVSAFRKIRFDKIINVQRFFTSGLLTVLSGAKETIGFRKNPLSFLFTRRVPHIIDIMNGDVHEIDRNLLLVQSFCKPERYMPRLYPSEQDFITTKQDKPYVTISPASIWFTKQYPVSGWVSLIDSIPDDVPVYVLGGRDDRSLAEEIRSYSRHPDIRICTGTYNYLQSVALISRAAMNYSNDSAPMHMASATNAPITALYCSTIPEFGFGPLSDLSIVRQYMELLPCRPCGLHGYQACPKGHFLCGQYDVRFGE